MKNIILIFFLALIGCGGEKANTESYFYSIEKDVGGYVVCPGCLIMTYSNDIFNLTYNSNDSCSGVVQYKILQTGNIEIKDTEYDVQLISGGTIFACHPDTNVFEIEVLETKDGKPSLIQFDDGRDIYKLCRDCEN